MVNRVVMIDQPCDRCGKVAAECHPFKLAEFIIFRGKRIDWPWLCVKCLMKEKTKWWKEKEAP